MSLNKATLIGHLGQDPEERQMKSGKSVVTMSVATTESWKKDDGSWDQKTQWHRIVVYNEHLGKRAMQQAVKGSRVYIEGQITSRDYTDQQGTTKSVTEITLKTYKGEFLVLADKKQQPVQAPVAQAVQQQNSSQGSSDDIPLDDVPF